MKQKKKCKKDRVFKMYEKAIEARNFHYKSYTAWTNLYAIFNGAFLVGFYSTCIKTDKCTLTSFLPLLFSLLGTICTFCWFFSFTGYYSWVQSWIKIVQDYEQQLNRKSNYTKNGANTNNGNNYGLWVYNVFEGERDKKDYYSTQMITRWFLKIAIIFWSVAFVFSFGFVFKLYCLRCCRICSFVVGILIIVIIDLLIYLKLKSPYYLSDIKNMKKYI